MRSVLVVLTILVALSGVWLLSSQATETESSDPQQTECWVAMISFQLVTGELMDETTCTEPGETEPAWECDFTEVSPVDCVLAAEFSTGATAICVIDSFATADCDGIDGAGSYECESLGAGIPDDVICTGDAFYTCNLTSPSEIACATSLGPDSFTCPWQSETHHFACEFVAPTPAPEPQQVDWGDMNCSGAANAGDGALILSYLAGLDASTDDCPGFGEQVIVIIASGTLSWGDIDCTFEIDPLDALWLFRSEAGLGNEVGGGCPDIGDPVTVSVFTFP